MGARPSKNEDCPKRQLSPRNMVVLYSGMAAKNFCGVTGQLKGHSHMLKKIIENRNVKENCSKWKTVRGKLEIAQKTGSQINRRKSKKI